jgi:AcrR family transcriptional regulator
VESQSDRPPAKRRRDPKASRAAILEAAREVFNERGYAGATIREIARRADVTHGLVMRHFGTKEQLLVQALPGPRVAAEVAPGDLDTLPERIAAAIVAETEPAGDGQTTFVVTLIRSAASGEDAAMPLYAAAEHEVTAAFRRVLGPGTEVYANLLTSLVIGVTFARHVARTGALAELTRDELVGYLVPAIRALLAPAVAAAQATGHGDPRLGATVRVLVVRVVGGVPAGRPDLLDGGRRNFIPVDDGGRRRRIPVDHAAATSARRPGGEHEQP